MSRREHLLHLVCGLTVRGEELHTAMLREIRGRGPASDRAEALRDGEARKFWPPEEAQARFCALTGYPSNRLWPYPTIAPALAAPTERTSP